MDKCDTVLNCSMQEAVMDLVSNVREGMRQRMGEVDWLDDKTRQLAIEKVKALFWLTVYRQDNNNNVFVELQ